MLQIVDSAYPSEPLVPMTPIIRPVTTAALLFVIAVEAVMLFTQVQNVLIASATAINANMKQTSEALFYSQTAIVQLEAANNAAD